MRPSGPFLDTLETRDPQAREAALMAALPAQVAAAQGVAALAGRLAGVDPASITSRAALAALPVTRKHELLERQQASRAPGAAPWDPFGGFSAIGWRALAGTLRPARRVYQSPGPIYEPDAGTPDYWRSARALFAAGMVPGILAGLALIVPAVWLARNDDTGFQQVLERADYLAKEYTKAHCTGERNFGCSRS